MSKIDQVNYEVYMYAAQKFVFTSGQNYLFSSGSVCLHFLQNFIFSHLQIKSLVKKTEICAHKNGGCTSS